jgi:cysteine synthase A
MARIDLTIEEAGLRHAVERARERNIVIPTYAQMKDPSLIPGAVLDDLARIGLFDLAPRNLFRITWHNEPVPFGGGFGLPSYLEFPSSLTGCDARIVALVGKWFPICSHKVGAAFGCLVPRLVAGQFDPTAQMAVWPSTGNYCRGGAYDSALLGCDSIAVLPKGMSRERFDALAGLAGEVVTTPGGESNVMGIFERCRSLCRERPNLVVFNQFDEFGNYLWHYEMTGHAMEDVLESAMGARDEFFGLVCCTGSAGTIAAGDYLKGVFPGSTIVAGEALQCPTMLEGGFGKHRIEGIGDRHVPWIHNVRNTDVVVAVDDNAVVSLARLFNEPAGREYLLRQGVPETLVGSLDLLGLSGIANLLAALKTARYFELGPHDVVLTVLTDSMDLYGSRIEEWRAASGDYTEMAAAVDHARHLLGQSADHIAELTYRERKRVHNSKYFTWVEQLGKSEQELRAQWYEADYWAEVQAQVSSVDALITEFNDQVGIVRS